MSLEGKADYIVICGSGNGIAMTVNNTQKLELVYVGLKRLLTRPYNNAILLVFQHVLRLFRRQWK
jgi:ribose 5-phosphate isomerase RpiB